MMLPMLLIIFVCVHLSSTIQSDVPAEALIQTSPFTTSSVVSVMNSESETRTPSSDSSTLPTIFDNSDLNQGDFVNTSPNGRSFAKISWNPVNTAVSTEALTNNTNDESTSSKSLSNNLRTDSTIYQTTQSIYDNLDHGENELDADVSKNTLKTTLNPDVFSIYKFETSNTENSTDNPISASTNSVLSNNDEGIMSKKSTTSSEYNTETPIGRLVTLMHTAHTATVNSLIKSTSTVTNISNSTSFTEEKDTSSPVHETNVSSSNYFEATQRIFEKNTFGDSMTETRSTKDTILVTEIINPLNDLKPTISTSSELFDVKTFQQNNGSVIENVPIVSTLHPTTKDQDLDLDFHITYEKILETETQSFSKQPEITTELPITSRLKNMITDNSLTEIFTAKHSVTLPPDTSPNIGLPVPSTPTFHIDSLSKNSSEANIPKDDYVTTTTEVISTHSDSTFHLNGSDMSTNAENKTFTSSTYDLAKDTELETQHKIIIHSSTASIFTESEIPAERTTVMSSSPEVTEIQKKSPSTVTQPPDNIASYTHTTSPSETNNLNVQEITAVSKTEKDKSQFLTDSITTYIDNPTTTMHSFSIIMHKTDISSNMDSNIVTERTLETTSINHEQNFPITTASHLSSTTLGISEDPNSSLETILTTVMNTGIKSTPDTRLEHNVISQTVSYPSSTSDHTISSTDHIKSTFLNTEETTESKVESSKNTDPVVTLSDKYSSSAIPDLMVTLSVTPETHREGKHIPFSTISTIDPTSRSGFRVVTIDKMPTMETTINETEIHFNRLEFEDLNPLDRTDMITAIIQFPANSVNKTGMKFKLAKTHIWLNDVLTKEFQNWTRDPFEESEELINEKPFGNISIFYVMPTPETNASHVTLTFIVYNAWKNETLPVHFVLGILNFYSKDLKESVNASAAYFYHGLLTENYDLLSAMLEKYGIIIFTICLAVVGVTVLICVVIFYRRKTRQSVHYLADSKLQHNMQEAVGIDLTPASIILQDEKEEKGNKICDDEGWLVPITDIPLAEESNGPNVQDTKL